MALPLLIDTEVVRTGGLDAFWVCFDTWASDGNVTDAEWKALFEQPGYKELDAVEHRSAWMKPIFELAVRPSQADEAKKRIDEGDKIGRLLIPHLQGLGARRKEISDFAARFRANKTVEKALAAAARYLPDRTPGITVSPPVYLILLDGDAKALREGIVADAATLSSLDAPELLIGHELHHYFRRKIDRVDLDTVHEHHRAWVNLLIKLEEEGIADLIDKRDPVVSGQARRQEPPQSPLLAWMWETYLEIFQEVPELIRDLESGLAHVADDPTKADPVGKSLSQRLLRLTGRPIGMFMAHAVEEAFGREHVKSLVGNPFAFVRAYARAAEQDPDRLPTLSMRALHVIRDWEEKYVYQGS